MVLKSIFYIYILYIVSTSFRQVISDWEGSSGVQDLAGSGRAGLTGGGRGCGALLVHLHLGLVHDVGHGDGAAGDLAQFGVPAKQRGHAELQHQSS